MEFFDRLDAVRKRWDVLAHPFYRRWECGELTRQELSAYAGEYRHAVTALAETAAVAAPLAGPDHGAEEAAHVELWDDFASALGTDLDRPPRPETETCVHAWTAAADPLEALAILYAIESGQPEISRTKLKGLVDHYGFCPSSRATAYFEVHAERDREHAAHSRSLLERWGTAADEERLVDVAETALAGNWTLLDGAETSREG